MKSKKIISIFLVLALTLTLLPITAVSADDTDITADFTDPNFLAAVRALASVNKPTEPILKSDVAGITMLDVSNKGIASLAGIEYFTALTYLNCANNQLIELDVSNNTALTSLYCPGNQLTELDLSYNTALSSLSCERNQLTKLDVSGAVSLGYLDCPYNQLTELDVSKNTELRWLYCFSNQLTKLDVSGAVSLSVLTCDGNKLTELDVSSAVSLSTLACGDNKLTELDVSKNTELTNLYCRNNQLTKLDVSNLFNLEQLKVDYNYIASETDVIGFAENGYIWSEYSWSGNFVFDPQNTPPNPNVITFPDPNFEEAVREIIGIPTGDILKSDVEGITRLDVYDRGISSLAGIEHFTGLLQLLCDENQLTELDISENTELRELYCANNELIELDVSKNLMLNLLYCSYNKLTELDISENTALREIYCYNNELTEIDVSKNTELLFLICNDNKLTELDLSKNISLITLVCDNNQLTELDVSNNTALRTLYCANNELIELDVSNNTELTGIRCNNNELSELNISNNTALTFLRCEENKLTELNVSNLFNLEWLWCQNNYIESEEDIIGFSDRYSWGDNFVFSPQNSPSNGNGGDNGNGGNNGGNGNNNGNQGNNNNNQGTVTQPTTEPDPTPEPEPEVTPEPEPETVFEVTVSEDNAVTVITVADDVEEIVLTADELETIIETIIENILEALEAERDDEDESDENDEEITVIDVTLEITNTETITLDLPLEILENVNLVIKTDFGTLTIPALTLENLREIHGENVSLTIKKGSFAVALLDKNGEEIAYNDPDNPFKISLPYEIGEDENVNAVVAVRKIEEENIIVPLSVLKNNEVIFNITATGIYDIIYNLQEFNDISEHWAKDYILFISAREITLGVSEELDIFAPEMAVSRAQFATFIARLEGIDTENNAIESSFSDINSNMWYTSAVEWAVKSGVTQGVGNGNFDPYLTITHEQMVTMLNRYLQYKSYDLSVAETDGEVFEDTENVAEWALEAVEKFAKNQLINGSNDGFIFDPQSEAERADMAAVLARFIEAVVD